MINEILEWCLNNWQLLVFAICSLIALISAIVPTKVKVPDTIKEVILSVLPEFINKVEEPGNGKAKLAAVVEMTFALINKLYPGINANQYRDFIVKSVNNILKTPQSKG